MIPRQRSSFVIRRYSTLPLVRASPQNFTMKTLKRSLLPVAISTMLVWSGFNPLAHAQTLPITSGLQLWLDADTGVTTNGSGQVTTWADQSGLGNNATQG